MGQGLQELGTHRAVQHSLVLNLLWACTGQRPLSTKWKEQEVWRTFIADFHKLTKKSETVIGTRSNASFYSNYGKIGI